ncbi:MAG: hypothetical protein ABSH47_24860 [Bryobacteraceae bacterium]
MEPTQAGIAAFANAHGWLGVHVDAKKLVDFDTRPRVEVKAELFSAWHREITEMRRLVRIWDWIEKGDVPALKQHFQWERSEEGFVIVYEDTEVFPDRPEISLPFRQVISDGRNNQLMTTAGRNPYTEPARYYLQRSVNQMVGRFPVWTRLVSGDDSRVWLYFSPENLIAALWIQFANVLAGNGPLRPCENCGEYFAGRADARYCRDACRTAAHRKRKEDAQNMHADGKLLSDIARQLRTPVDTVKRWIK